MSPVGTFTMDSFFGSGKDRCSDEIFPEYNNTAYCPENTNTLFADIIQQCRNGYPSFQVRLCQRDEYTDSDYDHFSAGTLKEDVMNIEEWTQFRGTPEQLANLTALENAYKSKRSQDILNQIQELLQQIDDTIEKESKQFDGLTVTTWNVCVFPSPPFA